MAVIVIFTAKFLILYQLFLISVNHLMVTLWDFEIKNNRPTKTQAKVKSMGQSIMNIYRMIALSSLGKLRAKIK